MMFGAAWSPNTTPSIVLGIAATFTMTLAFVVGLNRIPQILIGELNPHGTRSMVASYANMIGTMYVGEWIGVESPIPGWWRLCLVSTPPTG